MKFYTHKDMHGQIKHYVSTHGLGPAQAYMMAEKTVPTYEVSNYIVGGVAIGLVLLGVVLDFII